MMKFLVLLQLLSLIICVDCHEQNDQKAKDTEEMYSVLEKALIENKTNLFVLREYFFQTKNPSPSIVPIQYHLTINGKEMESFVAWTKVGLFKFVHPFSIIATVSATVAQVFNKTNLLHIPQDDGLYLRLRHNAKDINILYTLPDALARITIKVNSLLYMKMEIIMK